MKALNLSKEECIMIFNSLENVTIKGKDAVKLAPLLAKLDKHLVTMIQDENTQQIPDINEIASIAKSENSK
jgi:hypothetical protein